MVWSSWKNYTLLLTLRFWWRIQDLLFVRVTTVDGWIFFFREINSSEGRCDGVWGRLNRLVTIHCEMIPPVQLQLCMLGKKWTTGHVENFHGGLWWCSSARLDIMGIPSGKLMLTIILREKILDQDMTNLVFWWLLFFKAKYEPIWIDMSVYNFFIKVSFKKIQQVANSN